MGPVLPTAMGMGLPQHPRAAKQLDMLQVLTPTCCIWPRLPRRPAAEGLGRGRAVDLLDLEVAGARQVQQLVGCESPLPHIPAARI